MLLLGLDIGTSSIKASVVDAETQKVVASASYPEQEAEILVPQLGRAEQDPESWWESAQQAILKCHATNKYDPKEIISIGIAYQMHGLVLIDKNKKLLRNAIIWSDSRAVKIGEKAFYEIGEQRCLTHLLNSPGNFTAGKLAWVKANEPEIYDQTDQILLPGDFIAMKFTGEVTTSIPALSEGIFWDFKEDEISKDILNYYDFDKGLFPDVKPVFTEHGGLKQDIASRLSLKPNIPVAYKAGDQPNNALALNVLNPGEVAANAGTSGVIYGVKDQLSYDNKSRINNFAHVNYSAENKRIGTLLNINGTGIFNKWMRELLGEKVSYKAMNAMAKKIPPGAEGLSALPFGNGAERMFENKILGGHFLNLDFNIHSKSHLLRAVQEGIAFSFRYGLDIMRENGINPKVIKAGKSNLFLSEVFAQTFADVNNVEVEFYEGDGSYGAAVGGGIGIGVFKNTEEAAHNRKPIRRIQPNHSTACQRIYEEWKEALDRILKLE